MAKLRMAALLTTAVLFSATACGPKGPDTKEMEKALAQFSREENPAVFAAKDFDKTSYEAMVQELAKAVEMGFVHKGYSIGEKLATEMLKKNLPRASSGAILLYLRGLNGIYEKMKKQDLRTCVKFVHPQVYGSPAKVPTDFMGREERARFNASVYDLIKSAHTDKIILPSEQESSAALRKLLVRFAERKAQSAELLFNPGDSFKNKKEKELCQAFIDFNQLVLDGSADDVKAIRAFYSQW